ncbi:MAG TPA: proline--tRNA ligase [Actinobacteria bacterium]|nr:proline--tRNA ligase [Actinomycetota bacterium]
MRWSQAFIPTLREDPADAEAASHRLLVRGGFVRQLMAGVYSLLPLGRRVRTKVMRIIREEMEAIGAQEFVLPELHPAELWRRTGRYEVMADVLLTLEDHRGGELVLGPTHEEVFTLLAAELTSYRELPQLWYQIQTKFRDEPRPKSGLLRTREFTMKDSYSFDLDEEGLDRQFRAHYDAYVRIFRRLGLPAIPVVASSGAMGGSGSVEFMVPAAAGEDDVAHCPSCGYAANVERATSTLPAVEDGEGPAAPEAFPTPGVRTIADLEEFPGGAPADRQIKTLVYFLDGRATLVLLRGDHALQEQKLRDATGAVEVRPARPEEIRTLLGADAGSLGAVGVEDVPIIADLALRGRRNLVTGANVDDTHLRGVDVERDVAVSRWEDLRAVRAGEACPDCGAPLEVFRAIEAGHIFKLGTRYAEALGATVLDVDGKQVPLVMGSYGIGVERNLATIVEVHHDDKGIVWPVSVAPYEAVVTIVKVDDTDSWETGKRIYEELEALGVEVIVDDRDERPGVKFNDAELVGIPFRVTVGPRGLAEGVVELTTRATGEREELTVAEAATHVARLVEEGRRSE